MFVESPFNDVAAAHFERYSPFPYGSRQWKGIYKKRVPVERVFRRLKAYRKLNAIRTRRLPKVWLRIALSVLVMNWRALASLAFGTTDGFRLCLPGLA
jgi:transposase